MSWIYQFWLLTSSAINHTAAGGKHRAAAGKHGAAGREVTSPADRYYQVEKILKTETRRGKPYYFVQWRGWPVSFNSWVPGTDIKHI